MIVLDKSETQRNIFLEDMGYEDDSKKDLRGWNYERGCSCWRCRQFIDAAYWIVQEAETGKTPPRIEYEQAPSSKE